MSAPRGVVVYVNEASDPRFSKMQWDAACTDTRIKRPCLVWNRENEEQASVLDQKLKNQISRLKSRVDFNRQEALKPETPQSRYFDDLNAQIDSYNASIPPGQRSGRKRRFTIERAFKYEALERNTKKGGLDFVWYAFIAYEQELFPYYRQIRDFNPHCQVFICEDNVGVHHKARRLLADQIHEHDIKFIDTPANSPDLQPIKHLHKDQKRLISDTRFKTRSAAAAVQLQAEREMKGIWQHNKEFTNFVQ